MLTVLLRLLAELCITRPNGMAPGDGGPEVHRAVAEFERRQKAHQATARLAPTRMDPVQSLIAKRLPPTFMREGDRP